ncbi:hypothetical protein Mapa_016681 [Marchantia paleacea]|nr:hypothetical protein Mapa_016681 [Marchantia paleacea]
MGRAGPRCSSCPLSSVMAVSRVQHLPFLSRRCPRPLATEVSNLRNTCRTPPLSSTSPSTSHPLGFTVASADFIMAAISSLDSAV